MRRFPLSLILALTVGVSTSFSALASDRQINSATAQNSSSIAQVVKTATSTSQFVGVDHPTQGQVKIVEADGKQYLELSQDFKSDRGPDLKVILHQANAVGQQVQQGQYVNLGKLQSFNGTQRYLIPDNADLSQYQSVAIWCEQYNVTFGYAPLA